MRAAGHSVTATGVVERGPQTYAGLLPPYTSVTDPNAAQPSPILDPVREAQPYGPLRPPAAAHSADPEYAGVGHARAPHTGGTEAGQELVIGARGTEVQDEYALAGHPRRPYREEGAQMGGDAPGG
eukprot:15477481-Alexandrium_andersonii.AAC.1